MKKILYKILSLFLIVVLITPNYFVFAKIEPGKTIQAIKKPIENIINEGNKIEKIEKYINENFKNSGIAGYSYSIFDNKKDIQKKYYGISDDNGNKINENTVFEIASLSKSFTALSIMQLYENKKLDLKDTLSKYIPEIKFNNDERAKSITILNLLNQTSGVSSIDGLKISKEILSKENILAATDNISLNNNPGYAFEYSDLNYFILGYIIENVSGLTYDQYVENNIIKPLNLKNTFTNKSFISKDNNIARGFQQIFGFIFKNTSKYNIGGLPDSGLISNINDLSRYYRLYLNNGYYNNKKIISKDNLSMMTDTPILENGKSEYGMGWDIQYKYGEKILYHSGDMTDSHSNVFLIPNENIGFTVLVNTNSALQSINIESIVDGVEKIIIKNETPDNSNYSIILYSIISVIGIMLVFEVFQFFKFNKLVTSLNKNIHSKKFIFYKVILPLLINITVILTIIILYEQYIFDLLINIQTDIIILLIILISIPTIINLIKFIIWIIVSKKINRNNKSSINLTLNKKNRPQ